MPVKHLIILTSLVFLFTVSFKTFSQPNNNDTLAVRAILDSNGLHSLPVNEVVIDIVDGKITELDLESRDLTTLPSEIGTLTGLQYLYLYDNKLTSLPAEIGNLTKLLDLYLDSNSLTSLPPEIGSLNNLLWLVCNNNKLTGLPAEIGNLENLGLLDLAHNNLASLPDSITKLTPDEDLDISYNNLNIQTLADSVKAWADTYDPDWRESQITPIQFKPDYDAIIQPLSMRISYRNPLLYFYLPSRGNCKIQIYTTTGRLISTLIDSYKQAGNHSLIFNHNRLGFGVYYLKLSVENQSIHKEILILK